MKQEIAASERVWLPISRLMLRGRSDSAAILGRSREANALEAMLFALFYYAITLTMLGVCVLPGVAVIPFGRLLGWPILMLAHLFLLHVLLILPSKIGDLFKSNWTGPSRLRWQTAWVLGVTTLLAIYMLRFAGSGRVAAMIWLVFCGINMLALPFAFRRAQ